MAVPTDRESFRKYALRQLGQPVVQVNVAKVQQEDLIDDAIQYFHEYAFDGLVRVMVSHELTQDDLDNNFITVDDSVFAIIKVFPMASGNSSNPLNSPINFTIADLRHTLRGNMFARGLDIQNYVITQQYAQMVSDIINGEREYEFSYIEKRLTIMAPIKELMNVGEFLLFDTYRAVEGASERMWNHMFLKQYYVALLKRSWGENLKKFGGMQLPGGVELNGKEIYEEAQDEVLRLEDDAQARWSEPPHFFTG